MQAKDAFDAQNYNEAIQKFDDPYRKGVAEYKAGDYAKAEQHFREARRPEVKIASEYNLGNAEAQQGKYEEAIHSYQNVLKQQPDHARAKANLKIVQDLLKKKNQDQKQNNKNDQQSKDQQSKDQQSKDQQSKDQQGKDQQGKDQQGKDRQGKDQQGKDQQGKDQQGKDQRGKDRQGTSVSPEAEVNSDSYGLENPIAKKEHKKTQQDVDADQWLNRITNDPHSFLKNQFLIESARAHTERKVQPW